MLRPSSEPKHLKIRILSFKTLITTPSTKVCRRFLRRLGRWCCSPYPAAIEVYEVFGGTVSFTDAPEKSPANEASRSKFSSRIPSNAAPANASARCDFPTCRAPRKTKGLRPTRFRHFNSSSSALRFIYAILAGYFIIKNEIFVGNNL